MLICRPSGAMPISLRTDPALKAPSCRTAKLDWRSSLGAHQLDQYSVAQSPVSDTYAIGWKSPADCFENGAASENEVGASLPDAAVDHALLVGHRAQFCHGMIHFAVRHP